MSAPFMQLYVADYLGDTRHLTTEQHGAYLLLLMSMWRAGGWLPNDARKLARLCGCTASRWSKIQSEVMEFFTSEGNLITNKRLREELEKAHEKAIKRAEAGTRGGVANSLKNKEVGLANATRLPEHFSESDTELKKEKTTSSPKKGTRLPPDWTPTPEDRAFALTHLTHEDFRHEADQFRDFWIAKPGAAGVKLDWPATWRGWVRRVGKGSGSARKPNTQGNRSKPLGMAGVLAERRRQAGETDDVPGDGWLLREDDGIRRFGS